MPHQHPQPPRLTLISDSSLLSGEAFFQTVEQSLIGGVDAIVLREKSLTSAKLLALASRLRQITHAHQAQLIIHSQIDIAAAVDADGVHLASNEINNIASARHWLEQLSTQTDKSISVSCHHADELAYAHRMGADYAMLSPVFPTNSHPGAPHLGVQEWSRLADQAALPTIALGGISPNNSAALQGRRMAVISALLQADDPKSVAQYLSTTTTAKRSAS